MELTSIRQVSLDYGISRQMLSYYEEIGLIQSSRKDNSLHRVYDETAVRRLQHIVILRKLQIPMKQIKDVLNNQNAAAVIEIFRQNISELDEQITALSVVKSILTRLVDGLQEETDIHLKLDILNN
jgi:DNA-binding transcriptional MerR regulator